MALGRHSTDLGGRRHALGATQRLMARGLGIDLEKVIAIERGGAPDDRLSFYAAWLSRLEGAAPARRKQQFERAANGERFV